MLLKELLYSGVPGSSPCQLEELVWKKWSKLNHSAKAEARSLVLRGGQHSW